MRLGKDSYAMAYLALHLESAKQKQLQSTEVVNSFHSAVIICCLQLTMLFIVGNLIFGINSVQIVMPGKITILILRLIGTQLMHLQCNGEMMQGLKMMKYTLNHPSEFSSPLNAFFVGIMQTMTGFLTELACILYLGSVNIEIQVIVRYMALMKIGLIQRYYFNALPEENRIL